MFVFVCPSGWGDHVLCEDSQFSGRDPLAEDLADDVVEG